MKKTRQKEKVKVEHHVSKELQIINAAERHKLFEKTIRTIPRGKVATYGQIAEAAGYPRGHRLVARFLSTMCFTSVPWQRVIGVSGELKTSGRTAARQRALLKKEGVIFSGQRIDVTVYQHIFEE